MASILAVDSNPPPPAQERDIPCSRISHIVAGVFAALAVATVVVALIISVEVLIVPALLCAIIAIGILSIAHCGGSGRVYYTPSYYSTSPSFRVVDRPIYPPPLRVCNPLRAPSTHAAVLVTHTEDSRGMRMGNPARA